jgi:hypothetical protein
MMIDKPFIKKIISNLVTEGKAISVENIINYMKKNMSGAKSEMKETKLLAKIIAKALNSYRTTKKFDLDKEEIEFVKAQSKDIIKLIPVIVFQIVPGSTLATPFLLALGKKLGIKLTSKAPTKHEEKPDGELDELVDASGSFIGSHYPILDQGLHPKKTMDQTVVATRQTNNPVVRGYRVYYGESEEEQDTLDEVKYKGSFAWDEVKDKPTYAAAEDEIEDLGITGEVDKEKRLAAFGFDPELDKELKQDKKEGRCKKCFTKRRLSELQNQKMEKLIDEILLSKKQDSESIVKKQSETSDSPIEQILLRNLESVKRLADKEGLDINKLVKHLKSSE